MPAPMAWDLTVASGVQRAECGLAGGNEGGTDCRSGDRPVRLLRESPDETP